MREKRSFNLLSFAVTDNSNTRLEGTKQNTINNNTVTVKKVADQQMEKYN